MAQDKCITIIKLNKHIIKTLDVYKCIMVIVGVVWEGW